MTQRGKFVKPAAQRYLAYKERVGWAAREHGIQTPLTGRLYLRIWIYVQRRGRTDWDNWAKALTDSLNHIAYEDDSQIDDARVQVRVVQSYECVDIEIGRLL